MILLQETLNPAVFYPTAGAAGALLLIVTAFTISIMKQSSRDRKDQTNIITAQSNRIDLVELARQRDQVECNTRIDELQNLIDRKDSKINFLVTLMYKSNIPIPEEFWRL